MGIKYRLQDLSAFITKRRLSTKVIDYANELSTVTLLRFTARCLEEKNRCVESTSTPLAVKGKYLNTFRWSHIVKCVLTSDFTYRTSPARPGPARPSRPLMWCFRTVWNLWKVVTYKKCSNHKNSNNCKKSAFNS